MPQQKFFIGIDPGLKGTVALLDDAGLVQGVYKFVTHTVQKREKYDLIHLNGIFKGLKSLGIVFACLERTQGVPGHAPSSVYSLGYGAGIIEMALAVNEIPYELISPQKWKGKMLPPNLSKEKDGSVVQVLKRYPTAHDLVVSKRGARDHNTADAILLAEYGRITYDQLPTGTN